MGFKPSPSLGIGDKTPNGLELNNIKNIKLPVSAPFHSSLMSEATKIMSQEIEKLNFLDSSNKLISNVTAKEISSSSLLKDLLIK